MRPLSKEAWGLARGVVDAVFALIIVFTTDHSVVVGGILFAAWCLLEGVSAFGRVWMEDLDTLGKTQTLVVAVIGVLSSAFVAIALIFGSLSPLGLRWTMVASAGLFGIAGALVAVQRWRRHHGGQDEAILAGVAGAWALVEALVASSSADVVGVWGMYLIVAGVFHLIAAFGLLTESRRGGAQ